jgi:hypothetical protein
LPITEKIGFGFGIGVGFSNCHLAVR